MVFAEEGSHRISIANASGAILSSETVSAATLQIDISSYPQGIYILTIEKNKHKTIVKILLGL